LIEHFSGAFPLWLAPKQIQLIGVSHIHTDYVNKIAKTLREHHIRVSVDLRNEKLGKKIREAQMQKIPYILVLGDRELETETITCRTYKKDGLETYSIDAFLNKLIV